MMIDNRNIWRLNVYRTYLTRSVALRSVLVVLGWGKFIAPLSRFIRQTADHPIKTKPTSKEQHRLLIDLHEQTAGNPSVAFILTMFPLFQRLSAWMLSGIRGLLRSARSIHMQREQASEQTLEEIDAWVGNWAASSKRAPSESLSASHCRCSQPWMKDQASDQKRTLSTDAIWRFCEYVGHCCSLHVIFSRATGTEQRGYASVVRASS